jgi:hypothetical protein
MANRGMGMGGGGGSGQVPNNMHMNNNHGPPPPPPPPHHPTTSVTHRINPDPKMREKERVEKLKWFYGGVHMTQEGLQQIGSIKVGHLLVFPPPTSLSPFTNKY